MGKKQSQPNNNQSNKGHKTLRDKLRKKRQQLKKHKKQKADKHKQYDTQQQKKKFFEQTNSKKKKTEDGIKIYKLSKYIQKFVDIYQDDVQDFYELFDTLDQGGSIDISDVADPNMQKCLKKMFKYLPLKKKKMQYQKKQDVETKLRVLISELVTKSIQNYMQNGTQKQESQNQSSDQNQIKNQSEQKKKKQKKKNKKKHKIQQNSAVDNQQEKVKKAQIENSNLREYQRLSLYSQRNQIKAQPQKTNEASSMGPSISEQQRQYLAKLFEQQSQQPQQQNQLQQKPDESNQFDRIFQMASSSKRHQKTQPRATIDDIPSQLLAEGSARIGQKQQIDQQQLQQYNRLYRPRKLIEQHQQMRKLGKYAETDANGNKKRMPFDRQRDIVNGRSREFMNNGVFFDFKDKMTKPKGTSNFL